MMWRNLLASGRQIGGVNMSELFSATPYTGNSSTQIITNGLDLSTHGGLVWNKSRGSGSHALFDTNRGVTHVLYSDSDSKEDLISNALTSFNSDGFTLGPNSLGNANRSSYVSWAFRQAPGFFDIVSYTGDQTAGRVVPHNLGEVPGMIIIKGYSGGFFSYDWGVYHRRMLEANQPEKLGINLNTTDSAYDDVGLWNDTPPTASDFTLGTSREVNRTGDQHIAYLFAHNPDNGIYCGSYTGTGTSGNTVNLGWEPQFLLVKRATGTQDWFVLDAARGFGAGNEGFLKPNTNDAEFSQDVFTTSATGFTVNSTSVSFNGSGDSYIFMAIKAA